MSNNVIIEVAYTEKGQVELDSSAYTEGPVLLSVDLEEFPTLRVGSIVLCHTTANSSSSLIPALVIRIVGENVYENKCFGFTKVFSVLNSSFQDNEIFVKSKKDSREEDASDVDTEFKQCVNSDDFDLLKEVIHSLKKQSSSLDEEELQDPSDKEYKVFKIKFF